MSVVYIKNHNETVFDWEKQEIPKTNEIESTSKFNKRMIKSAQKVNKKFEIFQNTNIRPGSWGYAETPIRGPNNYLKKNEGIRIRKSASYNRLCTERRPNIPTFNNFHQQIPIFQKNEKNFKMENIRKIFNNEMESKQLKPKYVDTRKGDFHELKKSGMIPEYVYGKSFGKIPIYLTKIKQNIHEKTDKADKQNKSNELNGKLQLNFNIRRINAEERLELLDGLKRNWKELERQYQRLPVFTDTEHKKQRKTKIENELRKLEKDILLLENNPIIYVTDD